MAERKFYRKLSPERAPVLGNGATVKFNTLDSVVGYFSTDNEYIQNEFKRLTDLQQYGITEISAEEFEYDYRAKKNDPSLTSRRPWREEMGSGLSGLRQAQQIHQNVSAAVAVSGKSDIEKNRPSMPVVSETAKASQVVNPQPQQEFKPRTAKRKIPTKP